MFYVLYCPERELYLDDNGEYVVFQNAAHYDTSTGPVADAVLKNARLYAPDAKWVGPCQEGEEP